MFFTTAGLPVPCRRSLWGLFFIALLGHDATAQNQDPSLIGYWPFDGDGADLSGGDRPLELAGDVGFAPGLMDQALSVWPSAAQAEPGPAFRPVDDPEFDFGEGDFTIQAWVNYNQTGGEQVLIEKFTGGGGPGWTLTKLSGNVFQFYMGAPLNSPPQTIRERVWHQLLARRRGSQMEVFFDNQAVIAASLGPIPDSSNPLLIGMRNKGDARGFITDGLIDEVAIWNRALADDEIASLFNDGFGIKVTDLSPPGSRVNPPQSLSAAPGDRQVTLSWTAPVPVEGRTVAGYNVYRAKPGPEERLTASPVPATQYTVENLLEGIRYCFFVRAVGDNGMESLKSSEACAVTPGTADITLGLLSYWPFDGDGRDCSGADRPLEVAADVGFAPGIHGQALSVRPGAAQADPGPAFRPADDPEFDFEANDFTIQVWVNFNQTGGEQVLIEKFTGDGGPGWTLTKWFMGDIWQFSFGNPINSRAVALTARIWHQVLVRRNGTRIEVFYDNQIVAGANQGPVPDSPNPLLIGMRNKGDPRGLTTDGLIDEVAIWNRGLTDEEIHSLYDDGFGKPIPCRTGSISISSDCGFIPMEVQFSLETSFKFTTVLWHFGDGTTSGDLQPTHVYVQPGSYSPKAVVTRAEGGGEVVFEGTLVNVHEAQPQAQFGFSPAAGPAPLQVQFTDMSAGEALKRLWEFGDGDTSAASNPAHTYAAPGTYPVKLTVSGPCSGSPTNDSTALDEVTVGSLPYAELVQTGPRCVSLMLTNAVSIKGGEIGIAYDPASVAISKVKPGSGFPPNGTIRLTREPPNNCLPEDNVSAGFTLSWINSVAGNISPPGKHDLFKICFNLSPGAPMGACSALRFVDCLGIATAPAMNIVTSQNGSSMDLFTLDGQVCALDGPPFSRGDANADGQFDISDPIVILTCLFLNTDCSSCPDASDANDDGLWDITDAIYLLYWRFSLGDEPAAPFPNCDSDPTIDEIDECEVYPPCR